MYGAALLSTIIILISLVFLNNFEKLFSRVYSSSFIEIVIEPQLKIKNVVATVEKFGATIKNIEIIKMEDRIRKVYIKIEQKKSTDRLSMLDEISKIEYVKNISDLNK